MGRSLGARAWELAGRPGIHSHHASETLCLSECRFPSHAGSSYWLEAARVSVRPFSLEPSAKATPSPCEFSSMRSCFRLLIWLHSAGEVAVVGNSQEGASAGWQLGLSSVLNFVWKRKWLGFFRLSWDLAQNQFYCLTFVTAQHVPSLYSRALRNDTTVLCWQDLMVANLYYIYTIV